MWEYPPWFEQVRGMEPAPTLCHVQPPRSPPKAPPTFTFSTWNLESVNADVWLRRWDVTSGGSGCSSGSAARCAAGPACHAPTGAAWNGSESPVWPGESWEKKVSWTAEWMVVSQAALLGLMAQTAGSKDGCSGPDPGPVSTGPPPVAAICRSGLFERRCRLDPSENCWLDSGRPSQ